MAWREHRQKTVCKVLWIPDNQMGNAAEIEGAEMLDGIFEIFEIGLKRR